MGSQALPPVSGPEIVTQWQFAPIVTGLVVVAAGLYLWGVLRVRRRHPVRPWPLWRTALFLGGLAVIVIATQSGIGSYDDVLFWDHMVQHLLLLMVAPPLLVVGQPVTLLLHASRNPVHTWTKKLLRSHPVTWITWPPFGRGPVRRRDRGHAPDQLHEPGAGQRDGAQRRALPYSCWPVTSISCR